MKAILFLCLLIILAGTVGLKAQQKNIDQDKTTIDSTFTDKESPIIAWGTIKKPSEVIAKGYGPAIPKDISVAIPNAYIGDDSVEIPNAYRGDNSVPIPNAFEVEPPIVSTHPIDTIKRLKLKE